MENNPLSKKAFIDWMDKTYGWQDAQDYSGTFTQDIAIGFATSRVQALEEELAMRNKYYEDKIESMQKSIDYWHTEDTKARAFVDKLAQHNAGLEEENKRLQERIKELEAEVKTLERFDER